MPRTSTLITTKKCYGGVHEGGEKRRPSRGGIAVIGPFLTRTWCGMLRKMKRVKSLKLIGKYLRKRGGKETNLLKIEEVKKIHSVWKIQTCLEWGCWCGGRVYPTNTVCKKKTEGWKCV